MILIFVFLIGAIVGSFLNVCIYRLPRHESIVFPASHCPHCGKPIKFYDNIPLLSYVILRGKCRNCKQNISGRYPIIETISGLLAIAIVIKYGLTLHSLLLLLLVFSLIIVTFVDLDFQIIPDILSIPGIMAGIGASFFMPTISWIDSILGILAGGGFLFIIAVAYKWLTNRDGMGGGDIKLLAMVGAWLGWKAVPFILLISSFIGALIGSISLLLAKKSLRYKIPFGPFISIAAVIYLFFGPEIINWYINL
jgi:leader peptidase (prepilin peptidase) / N-methyltransferase